MRTRTANIKNNSSKCIDHHHYKETRQIAPTKATDMHCMPESLVPNTHHPSLKGKGSLI